MIEKIESRNGQLIDFHLMANLDFDVINSLRGSYQRFSDQRWECVFGKIGSGESTFDKLCTHGASVLPINSQTFEIGSKLNFDPSLRTYSSSIVTYDHVPSLRVGHGSRTGRDTRLALEMKKG